MGFTAIDSDPNSAHVQDSASNPLERVLDIAVVIVTYKCAQLTIQALRSLLTERATPGMRIRIVVVDNASGDLPEIDQVVEQCQWSSWVTLVQAPENGGFAYGNNLGIDRACASGPPSYVYLLNPDAEVRPGAIGSLALFMEAHPEVGIAGGSFENLEGSDWPIAFRFPTLMSELIQGLDLGVLARLLEPWTTVRRMSRSNAPVDWISGAAMMIRPAVFSAIGGLDENYFLCFEETDFCRRAKAAGFPTWYVPESRVMHIGGHSTNPTRARLPVYWFESRRRYFVMTFGIFRSMAIDVVAVIARFLGLMKRIIQRRQEETVPYFIRDLVRHSALWKRNREIPPVRSRIESAKHTATG